MRAMHYRANLALALRRLDHERASHRPGHGRRVVAIVNQAFSNVLSLNASGHLLESAGLLARCSHVAGRRNGRAFSGRRSRMNSCAQVPFLPRNRMG